MSSMAAVHHPMKRFWIVFDWKWLAWKHQIIFLVVAWSRFDVCAFDFEFRRFFWSCPFQPFSIQRLNLRLLMFLFWPIYLFVQLRLFASVRAKVCLCNRHYTCVCTFSARQNKRVCVAFVYFLCGCLLYVFFLWFLAIELPVKAARPANQQITAIFVSRHQLDLYARWT